MDLIIIITLGVSFCILYVLNNYYSKGICAADDADKAVIIRREFSHVRYFVAILTGVIVIITISFDDFHLSGITFGFIAAWSGYFAKIALPVSGKRPTDILPNEKFALYLRGFSFDNYEGIRSLQEQTRYDKFSEFHFINILNKYLPVYSVGMTKELSAPLGATRIYLNDAEWEKDVQELIHKAEMVIVLVNDSDSCIWEMENCYNLNKTLLIVDDKDKMLTVRGHFAKKHLYPFPISLNAQTILYHNSENEYLEMPFENTENSYSTVIKRFMKDKYGARRWIITSWQRKIFIGLAVVFLIPVIFIMTFAKVSNMETILFILVGVVIMIILYYLYAMPMSKWRELKVKDIPPHV